MENIILVSDVSNLTDADLIRKAETIATALETHTVQLPNPDPSVADLRAQAQDYKVKLDKIANLATEYAELKKQAKSSKVLLNSHLKRISSYVEAVANKTQNPSLVEAIGFKQREKGSTTKELNVPINVSLSEVKNTSGMLKLTFKAVSKARSYGIIWAYGATSPAEWANEPMKILTSSRNNKLPFEKGQRVWVRVKAYGPNDIETDWSDVVSRLVP